jgi:hypothetical protein
LEVRTLIIGECSDENDSGVVAGAAADVDCDQDDYNNDGEINDDANGFVEDKGGVAAATSSDDNDCDGEDDTDVDKDLIRRAVQ